MAPETCRECDAALAVTDRFCPACGTPNVGGKLHPRLPPRLEEREAYLDTMAAPGEAACPRCRRAVGGGEPFCRSCGFALDRTDPWQDAARAIAAGRDVPEYREPGVVSLWLRWVFRALVVVTAVAAGASVALAMTISDLRVRESADLTDRMTTLDGAAAAAIASVAGLGLFAAIVAAVWMRRALVNNLALGATPPRLGTAWVAPGLLVPGVNLVVPALLLDQLWKGSDPERPALDEGRWRSGELPIGLWIGWVLILLFAVVVALGNSWDPSTEMLANDQFSATLDAVAFGVLAVGLLLIHLGATPLDDRQEVRAERLGLHPGLRRRVEPDQDLVPTLHSGETWGRY